MIYFFRRGITHQNGYQWIGTLPMNDDFPYNNEGRCNGLIGPTVRSYVFLTHKKIRNNVVYSVYSNWAFPIDDIHGNFWRGRIKTWSFPWSIQKIEVE